MSSGVLSGFRIVEFAGIGPGPMAAMLLSDMGATVLRLERPQASGLGLPRPTELNFLNRGRRSVVVDLKSAAGIALALELVSRADALIEGFRPGVMEKLGLGPDACLQVQPRLVYGRITGWGQEGPLATSAGHDLNYIALSGALDAIGRSGQPPTPPLNLVGDYGGAVYLCMGMLAAMLEAQRSGSGQVVDAAMVDAATSMMASTFGLKAAGLHEGPRGTNLLDSGCPYYDVYACADGQYVAIAAIETKFRAELFEKMGMDTEWLQRSHDKQQWPALREELTKVFASRPREQWCQILEGSDACFSPVLSMAQAPLHPHAQARNAFVHIGGHLQPAASPRFSRSRLPSPTPPEAPGASADAALAQWGYSAADIQRLRQSGAVKDRA